MCHQVLLLVGLVVGCVVWRKCTRRRAIQEQEFQAATYFSNSKYAPADIVVVLVLWCTATCRNCSGPLMDNFHSAGDMHGALPCCPSSCSVAFLLVDLRSAGRLAYSNALLAEDMADTIPLLCSQRFRQQGVGHVGRHQGRHRRLFLKVPQGAAADRGHHLAGG